MVRAIDADSLLIISLLLTTILIRVNDKESFRSLTQEDRLSKLEESMLDRFLSHVEKAKDKTRPWWSRYWHYFALVILGVGVFLLWRYQRQRVSFLQRKLDSQIQRAEAEFEKSKAVESDDKAKIHYRKFQKEAEKIGQTDDKLNEAEKAHRKVSEAVAAIHDWDSFDDTYEASP